MRILAFDTSSERFSIALCEDEKILAETESSGFTRHSDALMPAVQKILKKCRLKPEGLDCVAVGLGPGSFTGLRVGVTVAKTMSYALKKKLIGVSSFEAIAAGVEKFDGEITVIADAKKGLVYAGIYRAPHRTLAKPHLITIDDLLKHGSKPRLFVGSGVELHREKILKTLRCSVCEDKRVWFPKAANIARIAWETAKRGEFADPFQLEPEYIHARTCNVNARTTCVTGKERQVARPR